VRERWVLERWVSDVWVSGRWVSGRWVNEKCVSYERVSKVELWRTRPLGAGDKERSWVPGEHVVYILPVEVGGEVVEDDYELARFEDEGGGERRIG
jgi:hypothetical protein